MRKSGWQVTLSSRLRIRLLPGIDGEEQSESYGARGDAVRDGFDNDHGKHDVAWASHARATCPRMQEYFVAEE
ncbi:hypothetical protein LDE02_12900 [Lactobacillus delbrueckii subsp. lactis]|nr:hypothetical protein LDE02_12900 [Lactobacillus delbrueckii subsp. lactis]